MRRYYVDDYEKLENVTTYPLWEVVNNYKMLLEYYKTHHYDYDRVSDDEIKSRIRFLIDNKVQQRDEIATLYWVLGEEDERKRKNYE